MRRFGFNLLLTLPNVDQGRALGGRTSCRQIRARDGVRVSADDSTEEIHAWDHGCQFFRADTAEFRECILPEWLEKEFAVVWDGRFGVLEGESSTREPPADFFGLPGHTPVFIGVGGMHSIATGLLQSAASLKQGVTVEVKIGARVATIVKCAEGSNSGKWQLLGTTGEAALHDSKEEVAAKAEHTPCSHHRRIQNKTCVVATAANKYDEDEEYHFIHDVKVDSSSGQRTLNSSRNHNEIRTIAPAVVCRIHRYDSCSTYVCHSGLTLFTIFVITYLSA